MRAISASVSKFFGTGSWTMMASISGSVFTQSINSFRPSAVMSGRQRWLPHWYSLNVMPTLAQAFFLRSMNSWDARSSPIITAASAGSRGMRITVARSSSRIFSASALPSISWAVDAMAVLDAGNRETFTERLDFHANFPDFFQILSIGYRLHQPFGDLHHLGLAHAPGGNCRRAEPNTRGGVGWVLIVGDSIFIQRNIDFVQDFFHHVAGNAP